MHWFLWNKKNSLNDFNLWISKLPKITRAPERHDTVEIPGRAGSLILLQGEDVYDSYLKECSVITVNTNPRIQEAMAWLRGSSELVFSNEPEMVYEARIVNDINFERLGNNLLQAKILFYCEPLKKAKNESVEKVTLTASGSIRNRGDVASKPLVSITATGNRTIVIGGMSMTFANLTGTVDVDCDAGIVTKNGALWTEQVTGEFWKIPKGTAAVTLPASTTVEITPRWRWV